MNKVDILIYNALSRNRSVHFPEFGILVSEPQSAALIDKNLIRPPLYRLYWKKDFPVNIDVIELIETGLAVSREQAEEEYKKWVKDLNAKRIIELFDSELNFNSRVPVKLYTRRRVSLWIILLPVIFLLLGALFYMYGGYIFDFFGKGSAEPWKVEISADAPTWQEAETQPVEEVSREVEATASNIYHIVVGVFSTNENADRFIASKPRLTLTKLDNGSGRILVCAYATATREEAIRMQERAQSEIEPAAWIWNSETKSAVNR